MISERGDGLYLFVALRQASSKEIVLSAKRIDDWDLCRGYVTCA